MRVISNGVIGAALTLLLLSACATGGAPTKTVEPSADSKAAVVRFGVAAEPYPPFSLKDASGQWIGFDVDVQRAVCEAQHLTCQLVEVPWRRLIQSLQDKQIDVIWASMSPTDERRKIIDFTGVYYEMIHGLVGRASDVTTPDMADTNSLRSKTIGVQEGTVSAAFVHKYFGGVADVRLYSTLDAALADLKAGHLDYVSEFVAFLGPFLDANPTFAVKAVSPIDPILNQGVAAGVRQEDAVLKQELNAGIAAAVRSGRYDQILERYPGLSAEIRKPQL